MTFLRKTFFLLMISILMLGFSSEVEDQEQPVAINMGQHLSKFKSNRILVYQDFWSYQLATLASFWMSKIMKRELHVIWNIRKEFYVPSNILFSEDFSYFVMFSPYISNNHQEELYLYHKGVEVKKIQAQKLLHSDCYDKLEKQTSWTKLVSPSWLHRIKLESHILEVTTLEGHSYRFNMKTGAVIEQAFSKEDLKAYNSLEGAESFTVHQLSLKPQNCEEYYKGPKSKEGIKFK